MATLFQLPRAAPVSAGNSYASCKAYFYQSGTTTPITTYTTAAMITPHANPVVANASGVFAAVYIDENAYASYRLQIKTSTDVLIYDEDNIPTVGGSQEYIWASLASRFAQSAFSGQGRTLVMYKSANEVYIRGSGSGMFGFRFQGQWSNSGLVPYFPYPIQLNSIHTTNNLGGESATATENWYAVFACANENDSTATFRIMPFLRVGSVAGSVITLNKAGEGIHTIVGKTYSWSSANNLTGTDCLIISEGGYFAGRITTITANSETTVTLGTIGAVVAYDYLLPAPPGYDHYCYLGSFYFDTSEVRNIYDAGSITKAKMPYITSPDTNGSRASPGIQMNAAGYISPLATAVILDSSCVLSTAGTGSYAEYFDSDGGGHLVQSFFVYKDNASNMSVQFPNAQVPFLYHQKFYYVNAGDLVASRVSGQLNITGWIEP